MPSTLVVGQSLLLAASREKDCRDRPDRGWSILGFVCGAKTITPPIRLYAQEGKTSAHSRERDPR